jgi:chromate transporter
MDVVDPAPARLARPGTAAEVFVAFLRLGLTSFGGPVAHLGYFHEDLVVRRRWLSDRAYADVVAFSQFLPGPASSQVGMAIGLQRAGLAGLLAAWTAFTLPSALLLVGFAAALTALSGVVDAGWVQGLKAAAVAVVAQAVLTMARTLAPDARRATIAAGAAIAALLAPTSALQVAVIAAAGLVGLLWLPDADPLPEEDRAFTVRVPRGVAVGCLVAYGALLAAFLVAAGVLRDGPLQLLGIFYRAGALVFGGGHVVLPLLESSTAGLVPHTTFLAGYGAAQAVPGPLFTFAAFLGFVSSGTPSGVAGAAVALVGIFLPGALLVVGALPFWLRIRSAPRVRRAARGVGAGVVGLLAAALYTPVFTSGVTSPVALAIVIAAFVALTRWSAPPWAVVIASALLGALLL